MVKKVVVEDINWRFDFGKHHGHTVGEVFDTDPTYLMWAHRETERFKLSDSMYEQLREHVGGGPNPNKPKTLVVVPPPVGDDDDDCIPF
jgi:hypothetical protein